MSLEKVKQIQTCRENMALFEQRYNEEVAKAERNYQKRQRYEAAMRAWLPQKAYWNDVRARGESTTSNEVFINGKKFDCTCGAYNRGFCGAPATRDCPFCPLDANRCIPFT